MLSLQALSKLCGKQESAGAAQAILAQITTTSVQRLSTQIPAAAVAEELNAFAAAVQHVDVGVSVDEIHPVAAVFGAAAQQLNSEHVRTDAECAEAFVELLCTASHVAPALCIPAIEACLDLLPHQPTQVANYASALTR